VVTKKETFVADVPIRPAGRSGDGDKRRGLPIGKFVEWHIGGG